MARKTREGDSQAEASLRSAIPAGRREGATTCQLLKTAEVLRETGITHQVLYRYVTLGLIEPAVETETGQRFFHPDVVRLVSLIRSFNQSGYSLRDLKDTFFRDKNVRRISRRR